jgi:hypothetical protein
MASTILIQFNVTEIATLGNGGGTSVKLSPSQAEHKTSGVMGNIELSLPIEAANIADFTHGEYQVAFTKLV